MIIIAPTVLRPLAVATCSLAIWLSSDPVYARCEWSAGLPTYMTFEHDLGSLWVPLDAEVGRVIADLPLAVPNREGSDLRCFYGATAPTTASMIPTTPLVPGIPVRAQRSADSVLRTNVDGIGAILTLGFPYDGSATNTFTSDDGTQTVPYNGTMLNSTGFAAPLGVLRGRVTLVKTGPIAPGEHIVDKQMFHGVTNDKGRVLDYTLKARVKQAQCKLLGNPVSADPVMLGDYTLADFTGPGPVGTDTPFSIRLSDCDDDSTASTAYAHIELDGTKGSTVVDAKNGIFSLASGSTATGFGIQILHGDGRQLPLQEAVSVKPLQVGVTQLDFRARFYQLDPKVTTGLAKGALHFTITYR
ncbi:fimbrial protein [Pseudomonas promysalinigenes]|uniref:Type 1 fimbrial protein n=1 Tax=Pseudomonas promysalinigenes TaxID=485898 RepID=A0ABY6AQB9_9PSED|nr:fimbrial protein [Pseudomonas promysalinigenes]UXH41382.1 type 1 fimbrial protein [Pseudomonas promysalinigenes]